MEKNIDNRNKKDINKYKYYKKQNELIEKNNEEEIISNNNKFINKNNTLYFKNILNDYTGSSWITQNSLAKKWLNTYLNSYSSSANNNIKAVAYLMDTNVWSIYAGNNAEYAIGAPTIELFCASYKDTHPDAYIECDSVTSNGYQVKMSTSTSYYFFVGSLPIGQYNGIYVKSNDSNLYGMWIASPSSYNRDGLIISFNVFVGCNGDQMYYSGDMTGLRPIICLKSDVHLEVVNSGTLAIVQ